MEKALELFAENGFEATSVQQITERCGISKGAFYLSFKSKDELILSLIDHFMSEVIVNIERSVNINQPTEDLLHNYYFTFFSALQQKASFAKIFMKEQFTSFNIELLEKMKIYNAYLNQIILSIVERQFTNVGQQMYGDLAYVIQGFSSHYGELSLFDNLPINIQTLCDALVEKTEIIAEHATIPIISREFFTNATCHDISITKEQLIDMLTQKTEEMEEGIIQESLQLLKQDLLEPSLSAAIIQGLLKNIQDHPHCKWVGYLYEQLLKNNG